MTGSHSNTPLLEVRDLEVTLATERGLVRPVRGVDFTIDRGETLTILGESGSGKSVTLRTLMRLLPARAKIDGSVKLAGQDVLAMSDRDLERYRGGQVAMIFQEPMSALDPVFTVGTQIAEAIARHEGISRRAAMRKAEDMLELVRIPSPKSRLRSYPHEMSGGMRQRVMIALALSCSPSLLLADEPTTALDVTVQIQILLLLRQLQKELGMAMIFVTHDIAVAAEISDRIAVMYAGRFVETGSVQEIISAPRHPYTRKLLGATILSGQRGSRLTTIPGRPPDLSEVKPGCAFAPRCDRSALACSEVTLPVTEIGPGRLLRCIEPDSTCPTSIRIIEEIQNA